MKHKKNSVTVFGCGYVGLTLAVFLAEKGFNVMAIDIDIKKIALLKKAKTPFFEPHLQKLLERNLKKKSLSFSSSIRKGSQHAIVFFSTVASPAHRDTKKLTQSIEKILNEVAQNTKRPFIFFNRSTVPIGSNEKFYLFLIKKQKEHRNVVNFLLAMYPEFLRQGSAFEDISNPSRIVLGFNDVDLKKFPFTHENFCLEQKHSTPASLKYDHEIVNILNRVFASFFRKKTPFLITSFRNAEMIKYASNTFLATKVSFINEIARVCEAMNVDVDMVSRGMELDPRIGNSFLRSGIGFGGSCLPKDLEMLITTAKNASLSVPVLEAVKNVNEGQSNYYLKILKHHFLSVTPDVMQKTRKQKLLLGKRVALWGLAFKPNTDDLRDAPALKLIKLLQEEGCSVQIYDPIVTRNAKNSAVLKNLILKKNMYETLTFADVLIIATEWPEFANADLNKVKKLMRNSIILDGRGIWNKSRMKELGFAYYRPGSTL